MPIAVLEELCRLAQASFDKAKEVADAIQLSTHVEFSEVVKEAKHYSRTGARLLAREPGYENLEITLGVKAWGALLAFDLRDSSNLAAKMSPRDMYLIMHTYLPTVLAVIKKADGIVVGLRGDGAIACFGLVESGEGKPRVTKDQAGRAVAKACNCGDAIVKAVHLVVNGVLAKAKIGTEKIKVGVGKDELRVGVGIDVGDIVATKIGLGEAHELTAYGTAVNFCCKRSFGNDKVVLTKRARDMFPKEPGGKTQFPAYPDKDDAYILRYPDSHKTLG
jgi:class 3 adenylate cyclase